MEPLPPVKEVEYRCIIGKIFEELSGSEYITFAFETAKEFSNFRYEIAVRYRIQPGSLEFKVLGMTATRTMMPAFGTARSVLKLPLLPLGIYTVKMIKSDGIENIFTLEVTKRGIQILPPVPRKRFIDLVIERKAAAPGARITSTVSKTPPPPLIPRTIQKRQPTPPTPEELALLETLRTETPEERDHREEIELFGGKKKVDKKELEAAEHDLKKLGETVGLAGTSKPGAKRPQEEVKEIPANGKHAKEHVVHKPAPVVHKPAPAVHKTAPAVHKAVPAKSSTAKTAPAKSNHKAKEMKHVSKPAHAPAKKAKVKTVSKAAAKPAAKPAAKHSAKIAAVKKAVKPARTKSSGTKRVQAPAKHVSAKKKTGKKR